MRRSHLGTILQHPFAWPALLAAFAMVALPHAATAQVPGGFEPFNLSGNAEPTGPVVKAKGVILPAADGKPAQLVVTADVEAGWHIYSITQPPGGPIRTSIKIPPSADYKLGEFKPGKEPHAEPSPEFNNIIVETHDASITWTAPLDLSPGVDPAKLKIEGAVNAQACSNTCLPPQDYKFTAQIVGAAPATPAATSASSNSTSTLPAGGPPVPTSFAPPTPSTSTAPTSNTGGPPLPGGLDKFTQPAGAPPMPATGAPAVAAGAPDAQLTYKASLSHATWTGSITPSTESHGKPKLSLRAVSEPEWHVYSQLDTIPDTGNRPTIIVFNDTPGLMLSKPTPDAQPTAGHTPGALAYFEQPVTWTSEITVPDFKPGVYRIKGAIGYQTCKEATCDPPKGVNFEAEFTIESGDKVVGGPVRFVSAAAYKQVAEQFLATSTTPTTAAAVGDPLANIQIRSDEKPASLPYMLLIAFMAGFILNFMPCVLPVIGLKVLSFVEQSGHDRKKILSLNLWYALGMISVFWVLAAIPIVFKTSFGWGQQFSYDGFTITLVAIVFAMALSFLGVWEIPIPGFAGSGGAQKLASKEGVSGAYFKGIITTLLATPCSGPGLAAAVGFAFRESAPVGFAIFTAMGLGMASPYILIGFQPSLLRFLPKPGEWMDTFKQIMGFVLLGTVVWLMTSLPFSRLVPTVTLMFGLWAACWWIGRTPVYAEFGQKTKAWIGATVWSLAIGWFSFTTLQGIIDYRLQRFVDGQIAIYTQDTGRQPKSTSHAAAEALNWQHLTLPQLQTAFASNQTVLVDFTADWCATCKLLKSLYLDKPETKQLVDDLGVVTFEADMTSPPQELTDLLRKLNPSGGVPVIAIFPAGDPSRPIVFADGYTQTQIFDALRKAGKSKPKTAEAATPKGNDAAAVTPADDRKLSWQIISSKKLEASIRDGKTVLIDFSADWDPISVLMRSTSLEQPEIKALVEELGVTPFRADMTQPSDELLALLKMFSSNHAVPTLVVVSASEPSKPLVMNGPVKKEDVVAVLKRAGPSKSSTATTATQPAASPKSKSPEELEWKFMTVSRLRAELNDRKTVLINFTSDWCPTCKPYRDAYLNELNTKQLVEELDVVSFEADMTRPPEEMRALLRKLNPIESLPTWVVFSASDPSSPIVIADGHSKEAIHKALREAGKSLTKTNDGAVGSR